MINTALYSLWSKPFINLNFKKFGEFNNKEECILSWKTSIKLSKKYIGNVILVTDNWAWDNLFKDLKLPIDELYLILDDIDINYKLWSISKAYAIKKVNVPFIHVDSDVYFWKKPDDNYLKSDLLVQSPEGFKNKDQFILYNELYWDYINNFKGTNKYLDEFNPCKMDIYAYNCGVLGGNNIKFLHYFADNMINACELHSKKPDKISNMTTALLEQTLLKMMIKKNNINVNYILDDNKKQDFYTHLAGNTKRNKKLMEYLKIKYESIFKD